MSAYQVGQRVRVDNAGAYCQNPKFPTIGVEGVVTSWYSEADYFQGFEDFICVTVDKSLNDFYLGKTLFFRAEQLVLA